MRRQKGFTLIELLVVIAIIGVLASLVIVNLSTANRKSRDSRRKADLNEIKTALELYYDDFLGYPAATSSLAPNYIKTVPTDPRAPAQTYTYTVAANGSAWTLNATLESPRSGEAAVYTVQSSN
jgi:type II secretion system protein G